MDFPTIEKSNSVFVIDRESFESSEYSFADASPCLAG